MSHFREEHRHRRLSHVELGRVDDAHGFLGTRARPLSSWSRTPLTRGLFSPIIRAVGGTASIASIPTDGRGIVEQLQGVERFFLL